MKLHVTLHPFKLTVRVWRFMLHTAPIKGRRRVFAVQCSKQVCHMRISKQQPKPRSA